MKEVKKTDKTRKRKTEEMRSMFESCRMMMLKILWTSYEFLERQLSNTYLS